MYYKQKKYKQALQVIETALQTVKNEWVIWSHYGDILDKIGKKDKALQAYQKALELSKETDDKNNIQQKINLYT
ncbi:MAG: tetratricopeptide repeat protein, partial [Deltaproteobacteria bacterium]|nr:tetratricopeptide repeat protein [Deltaproteobacteria bacterium]